METTSSKIVEGNTPWRKRERERERERDIHVSIKAQKLSMQPKLAMV